MSASTPELSLSLPEAELALGSARSVMRELFEYGKQRAAVVGADNVFDFSLGNPSVPPPPGVGDSIAAALAAPDPGAVHAYTSAQGDAACRAALAASLNARFGAGVGADDLYLTVGAAASLTITLHALCCPGDEVVLLAPFFAEYRVFAEGAGAKVVVVPANTRDFQPDIPAIAAAITPRTKAVLINTPNNPSGAVYTPAALTALAALLRQRAAAYGHAILLVSDEPYRELAFAGHTVSWVPALYEDTIVCYSYSKSLSIPGERIGYILLPPTLTAHDQVYAAVCGAGRRLGFVNAPALFQRVVAACDGQTADLGVYQTNAQLLAEGLRALGYSFFAPQGTFYLFLRSPIPDAVAFCQQAQTYDLLLVPADSFACPGWVRIAYCIPTEKLRRALPAFARLAAHYGLHPQTTD